MTAARPASHAATNSSRVQKHEPVVGWTPNQSSCSSLSVKPQLSISLALAIARDTGGLPQQSLEQEMALLGLTIPDTNQIRTANPAKLETDSLRTHASARDLDGAIAQPLFPPEALEDVSL